MDINDLIGLRGKNVLVTGAGSGMGYAAAQLLKDLGANVYATVRRKPLDFEVIAEIKVDLSKPEEIENLVNQLPEQLEAIYLCHGISNSLGNTNGLAVQVTNFLSFKEITERLIDRISDNGSVTFISSDGGKEWFRNVPICSELLACNGWEESLKWYEEHPDKVQGGYVFAKMCQDVYVKEKAWAPEFINRRIRINAIAPGMTKTGLTHDFNASITGDADQGHAILERLFIEPWNGRWASPGEQGYPMVLIGSMIFSYMSGEIINIDYGTNATWLINELKK